jgi:predicted ribosomally synthesized peptide with nif11-like leader
MSRESIEELVERWMEDTTFRSAVRKDPVGTIRATGLDLTPEEWAAVRNLDWTLSDEELSARASKSGGVADGCL